MLIIINSLILYQLSEFYFLQLIQPNDAGHRLVNLCEYLVQHLKLHQLPREPICPAHMAGFESEALLKPPYEKGIDCPEQKTTLFQFLGISPC